LQNVSAEAVDTVAHFKLGGSEELAVVLAGHQAGEVTGLTVEGVFQVFVEGLSFDFLLGGEV
jgi:hypothetical protein